MMGIPIVSHGTGPPYSKLALPGRVAEVNGVLHLPLGWLTVSKGQTWQLALAIMLVLLASSAAYNEEYSTVSYQTVPGTSPGYSDSLAFQNSIERSTQAEQDLRSSSTESWLGSVGNPYARNSSASSVGTVGQSHNASTQWNSIKVSGSLEVKHDGQGHLSGDSVDFQSSIGLTLATSPSAGALARTTGLSPKLSSKESQQLEFNTLSSSLPQQTKDAEIMEQSHTIDALRRHLLTSPSSVTSSSLPLGWNLTHQITFAINTVPDQSPSATILTVEQSSSSEHVTRVDSGLLGTLLSSSKTVQGSDVDNLHGDHSGTVPSTETRYWSRLKELPHLQSSGSPDTFGASSADFSYVTKTTADGTTDERMEPLISRPGATAHSSLVSGVDAYASIMSVLPPTQTSDPSSETTSSQQISRFNGQEFDVTDPATREPLSHSFSKSKAPTHIALVKSSGFTGPRETKESSTYWLYERLSVDQSSWHTPDPVTEFPNMSNASAVNGSHTSIENYTEALLSVSHYKKSLTTGPPSHAVSVGLSTSSSSQPTVLASTLQDSQWSETTSGLPSRNSSLPVMLQSPKASTNTANVSVGQQVVGTATDVPHSFAAGMPGFGPSPATTDFELDTVAFGMPSEANVFVGHQSTILTEQIISSTSLSFLQSYLGSAKEKVESPATETISSTLVFETRKAKSKEGPHFLEGEYTSPSETSTRVAILSVPDRTSFLSMQTSSHPPLYSRSEIEYLNSWAPSAEMETSPLEGLTITAHHREWTKTEHHEREEQTQAAVKMMSTDFSELPLTASDGMPVTDLFSSFASSKPEVQSTYMYDALPRQGIEATQLPPHDSTHFAVSKQPSEMKVSSVAKKSGSSTVHTPTAGSPPLSSYPYLVVTSAGIAPGGKEYAGLVTGRSAELFSMTPSEFKVATQTPSHITAASTDVTEAERTSVAPTYRSVSPGFMSSVSTRTNVSESTTEATKGLMARREWIMPASTMLSSTSNTEVQSADPRAARATSAIYQTPPFLSTMSLGAVTSISTVMTEDGLGHKAAGAFTDTVDTITALPVLATAQAVPMSTIVNSGAPSSTSESRSSTTPAPITPLQNTSAWLSTSESLLARKSLITTLGSMNNKSTIVSSTEVPSLKETNATVPITSTTTEDVHTSKHLVPKLESQTLSQTTEKEFLTLSSPTSHAIAVYSLSLQFRLIRIDYTKSLENKSSNSYKKLEKEVRLTLNKMLSSYGNFLYFKVLRFLNGSVVVESKAVFQGDSVTPTPSDVIRTIVTEVEERKMDTFFDWRVDLKSLQSNGFGLNNLEPEMLTVSFTFLGSAAAFVGMSDGEPLERLRSEVILLLGTQYQVQNLVLYQAGNSQGDLDITGEVYINTSVHVNIHWVLEALRGLVNYSVDLSSLSVNGSRLGLQVFPFSFLVTNRNVNKELLDRSSRQHKALVRNISDVLMHILRQYKNFLQVKIREITGGSLMCHGDVIFQHPAPSSKDVLKTLALAIGPKDYLAASSLQVDRFSFNVAGDGLEPPFTRLGVPAYGVALIVMCALAIIAIPVLNLLPKILGRKDKINITRAGDLEAGGEIFELDNPGYHSIAEDDSHDICLQRL